MNKAQWEQGERQNSGRVGAKRPYEWNEEMTERVGAEKGKDGQVT